MKKTSLNKHIFKLVTILAILLATTNNSYGRVICLKANGGFALEMSSNGHDCLDKNNLHIHQSHHSEESRLLSLSNTDECTDISLELAYITCPSKFNIHTKDCILNTIDYTQITSYLIEISLDQVNHYPDTYIPIDTQKEILRTTILLI